MNLAVHEDLVVLYFIQNKDYNCTFFHAQAKFTFYFSN